MVWFCYHGAIQNHTSRGKPCILTSEYTKPVTDQPKKTLTLKKKRIIRRADISAERLGTAKPKAAAPKPKPKPRLQPKRPTIKPSDTRLDNLNGALSGKKTWCDYKPLAHGIEKQVFQFIALHKLSASKRIVQRLIKQHTSHERYLTNIIGGGIRHNLDGTESGEVATSERQHARKLLAARTKTR